MPVVKRAVFGAKKSPPKKTPGKSKYAIPSDANEPPKNLFEYGICIFGLKNVGKSSLAAAFPKSFTMEAEVGRRSVGCRQVPKKGDPPLTWEDIVGYTEAALNNPSVDTLVYDTIDKIYLLCQNHYCDLKSIKHPNDAKDYGATHTEIKVAFAEVMDSVKLAGKTPIWLSHCATREVYNSLTEETTEKLIPSCQSGAWAYLQASADFVFCYLRRGVDRVMVVRGSETIEAACGPSDFAFLDVKTKKPLAEVPMGTSAKQSFKNLCDAFQNKMTGRILEVVPAEPEPVVSGPKKSFKLTKLKPKK